MAVANGAGGGVLLGGEGTLHGVRGISEDLLALGEAVYGGDGEEGVVADGGWESRMMGVSVGLGVAGGQPDLAVEIEREEMGQERRRELPVVWTSLEMGEKAAAVMEACRRWADGVLRWKNRGDEERRKWGGGFCGRWGSGGSEVVWWSWWFGVNREGLTVVGGGG